MSQNTNSTKNEPATICRAFGWNKNLCNADPAYQYKNLKLIQNTVRVPGSLYIHDLGPLTAYQQPLQAFANVNWNQMSDRAVRHVQPNNVAGGSFYHSSSTKSTITRCRPGAGCPGGSGVDIKHNSYERRLNRLKGRGPLRRGVIPPNFGTPLPFNRAAPIYGGKTTKTSIVGDNCGCPIGSNDLSKAYSILFNPVLLFEGFKFVVGNIVYAFNPLGFYARAVVISGGYPSSSAVVKFDNGSTATVSTSTLFVYFPCNCDISLTVNGVISNGTSISGCYILDQRGDTNNIMDYLRLISPNDYQSFLSAYNL
jgi:hypothetical protein